MKKWMKKVVAVSFVVAQFLVIPNVSASSLEDIRSRKNTVAEEVTQLQAEVSNGLEEVSEITLALDELNKEIEEHKSTITQTEEDIVVQEKNVQERYEYTADQLIAMQKNEVNQNIMLSLFESESLTDLLNKIYSASILTGASEQRLVEAQEEQEKLNELRETLLVEKEELDEKQVVVVQQKEELDVKVAKLRETLTTNESELANLNAKEDAIVRAVAEKAEAEKRAVEAQRVQEKQSSSVAVASSNTVQQPKAQATKPTQTSKKAPAPSSAGQWMTFQATGYSTQQPGLSTHTAMGIDLRINPRVIAVDPNLIPLGSMVEVQGLGVYIAGDTGGAIKGNIIDIHYPTVSQALSWGRRSVNIRIIN